MSEFIRNQVLWKLRYSTVWCLIYVLKHLTTLSVAMWNYSRLISIWWLIWIFFLFATISGKSRDRGTWEVRYADTSFGCLELEKVFKLASISHQSPVGKFRWKEIIKFVVSFLILWEKNIDCYWNFLNQIQFYITRY